MIPVVKDNSSPVLFEKLISEVNELLLNKLEWLNYAFGRAYTIERLKDNSKYLEPAIYTDGGEYFSMLPNEELGNFSFIVLNDPQVYDDQQLGRGVLKTTASIIFWFNLLTIFSDSVMSQGLTENIKYDIMKVISTRGSLTNGRIKILSIEEKAENIYKGYSISQIENQHLINPFAGFKFICEVKINELC